ncbi:unnamed protein product [Rotaria sordida]|uniref:Envelope protein n=1 Tax=Rotaria sordida TaxID=392033 RepID=A0A814FE35_9BILA|nr:unnamed protein product [Rotaria sordida]
MLPNIIIILLLFYVWFLCSTINTFTTNSFNRKVWGGDDNIFHINQGEFQTVFQQYRNVNEHINWLANEISLLNRQIKLIKDQISFIIHNREQHIIIQHENTNNINNISSSKNNNTQNIYIIKLLSYELLFNDYLQDLSDIYEISLTKTIECIAVFIEKDSIEKYLFIKLSNGNIDTYQMNKTKSLKETYWNINQSISIWVSTGKQLEYYQRFIQDNNIDEIINNDQLMKIKDRPQSNDVHFFNSINPILRIKYHTDPSSLSCILEDFFDNIYTCNGQLVYPHELKLLSNDKNQFMFYAVMVNTTIEKHIYPLETNHHIRHGDQLVFLFNNHPQMISFTSCTDCRYPEQTDILNNDKSLTEEKLDNLIVSSQQIINIEQNSYITNSQNYIVYFIVASILLYILFSIYLSGKQQSTTCLARKHSILPRRDR